MTLGGDQRPSRLAYLGLGSNLGLASNQGDRAGALAAARAALQRRGVEVLRTSSVLETEPWGVADQPRFLNQVVEVRWRGSPEELLATAKAVEADLGRRPRRRWGPREIDVDILLVPGLEVNLPDLVIPHPRIGQRDFVRAGLAELGRHLGDTGPE